ncbi:MAG: hypothetical protein ACREM6_16605 [Vulcanimicrobiaceae bacterium]
MLSGDEHVVEYRPPVNVVPIESGKTLAEMVISGELAAAIGIDVKHPDVKPLIPNAIEAGLHALHDRGEYPINHLIVVKDDVLAAHADLAPEIFNAFAEAKRRYIDRLKTNRIEQPTEVDNLHRRVMEMTGDPLPYGIEPNRNVIETLIAHAVTQRIIPYPVTADELFAANTRTLSA